MMSSGAGADVPPSQTRVDDNDEFWRDFRAIQASTQKRTAKLLTLPSLKRPNLGEAIAQLRELAHEMEHAAICHREIAILYERLQSSADSSTTTSPTSTIGSTTTTTTYPLLERQHWLRAAHLFRDASRVRRAQHSLTNNVLQPAAKESEAPSPLEEAKELDSSMVDECYARVADKDERAGQLRLSALTHAEAGAHFEEVHRWASAWRHYLRAARLNRADVYFMLALLPKLCALVEMLQPPPQQSVEAAAAAIMAPLPPLAELRAVWSALLAAHQPLAHHFTGAIRERLFAVEVHLVLVALKQEWTAAGETENWKARTSDEEAEGQRQQDAGGGWTAQSTTTAATLLLAQYEDANGGAMSSGSATTPTSPTPTSPPPPPSSSPTTAMRRRNSTTTPQQPSYSVATRDERALIADFIGAFRARDHTRVARLHAFRLDALLASNERALALARRLVDCVAAAKAVTKEEEEKADAVTTAGFDDASPPQSEDRNMMRASESTITMVAAVVDDDAEGMEEEKAAEAKRRMDGILGGDLERRLRAFKLSREDDDDDDAHNADDSVPPTSRARLRLEDL